MGFAGLLGGGPFGALGGGGPVGLPGAVGAVVVVGDSGVVVEVGGGFVGAEAGGGFVVVVLVLPPSTTLPWLPVVVGVVAGAVLGVDNGRCSVALGGMDPMAGGVDPWLAVGDGAVVVAEGADVPFGESPVDEPDERDAPNAAGDVFPPADCWPKWITARLSATTTTITSGTASTQWRCSGLGTGVSSTGLSTGLSSEPKYHEPSSPRYCERPCSSRRRPTDPIPRTLSPQLPLSLSSICGGWVMHSGEGHHR